jgi:hypothetical protein
MKAAIPSPLDRPPGGRRVHGPVWLVFAGVELAAVAMVCAGFVGHDVPREPKGSKVNLLPFVTPQASGLSLQMRW